MRLCQALIGWKHSKSNLQCDWFVKVEFCLDACSFGPSLCVLSCWTDYMPRIFGGIGCLRVRVCCFLVRKYWLTASTVVRTFLLSMRVCQALIMLQHSKSALKCDGSVKVAFWLTLCYFALSLRVCFNLLDWLHSTKFQLVRIESLYWSLAPFCGDCEISRLWLCYSIWNRIWSMID